MKRRLLILLNCLLMLLILAMPVGAQIRSGYVSNLLAPLYGSSQTRLIGNIGCPIGSAATVDGYTLTADAVIGDRYHTSIVYTLTRVDGGSIPRGAEFKDHEISVLQGGGGGSWRYYPGPDGKAVKIVEQWTSSGRILFNRQVHSTFANLTVGNQIIEGTWELKFAARFRNSMTKIPVKDLTVLDSRGQEFTIHKLYLSPVGLHIDMTAPNWYGWQDPHEAPEPVNHMENFTVSVQMMDGSMTEIRDWNCGFHSSSLDAPTAKADYGAMFDEPLDLRKVAAVRICNEVIPVKHQRSL